MSTKCCGEPGVSCFFGLFVIPCEHRTYKYNFLWHSMNYILHIFIYIHIYIYMHCKLWIGLCVRACGVRACGVLACVGVGVGVYWRVCLWALAWDLDGQRQMVSCSVSPFAGSCGPSAHKTQYSGSANIDREPDCKHACTHTHTHSLTLRLCTFPLFIFSVICFHATVEWILCKL